jgi:CheY-like chemotaxis protein
MIIFVDDEARRMSPYLEACEFAGLEVELLDGLDEAWQRLRDGTKPVDVLLLVVMMPSGSLYSQSPEVLHGIRTGLLFYRDVRKIRLTLPIVLLTQSSDAEVDAAVRDDQWAVVVRKQDLLPSELPNLLREQLRGDR